jgi:pilus assembly protein CpaF
VSGDLVDRVRQRLATGSGPLDLGELVGQESALLLDSGARSQLSGQLAAELTGAGPLEELLAGAGVTDVLVNAPDRVWLDRGAGLERAPVRFDSDAAVRRLATRLAAQAGRRLDDAAPFVDAVLPDAPGCTRSCRHWWPIRRCPCGCWRVAGWRWPTSSPSAPCPARWQSC